MANKSSSCPFHLNHLIRNDGANAHSVPPGKATIPHDVFAFFSIPINAAVIAISFQRGAPISNEPQAPVPLYLIHLRERMGSFDGLPHRLSRKPIADSKGA